ncbi:hypothetical protein AVEN_216858-1 [Araneus ventricosus]|uniref:Uncharacterized protein n=1 Tax=Araneus ventricosus TaxID=182803 RepID=A0A4Y2A9N8_ARAVE|nr:hypothetical protein AVEN_216858-1 [Araneus ventricosus]
MNFTFPKTISARFPTRNVNPAFIRIYPHPIFNLSTFLTGADSLSIYRSSLRNHSHRAGSGRPRGAPGRKIRTSYLMTSSLRIRISLQPSKNLFPKTPTQRPLVNKPPTSEKVLEVSFLRTKKKENKGQTPHPKFPENQRGRDHTSCTPSQEKKKWSREGTCFLNTTLHCPHT